ncbi:hypothetical protein EVAR_24376_1 [Eumeta japonica]|uniref:Uncharacterized protein n=1 Tax=Eumeta variegata TaxID=151549 RepID=A0A4C1YDP0_EUMVA|nr:hypothetical protein EVAR_24376_1 [Eumeta japonica]
MRQKSAALRRNGVRSGDADADKGLQRKTICATRDPNATKTKWRMSASTKWRSKAADDAMMRYARTPLIALFMSDFYIQYFVKELQLLRLEEF